MHDQRKRRIAADIATYVLLTVLGIIWLLPIVWIFLESFKKNTAPYQETIMTFIVLAVVSLITYRSSGSYKNEEAFRRVNTLKSSRRAKDSCMTSASAASRPTSRPMCC